MALRVDTLPQKDPHITSTGPERRGTLSRAESTEDQEEGPTLQRDPTLLPLVPLTILITPLIPLTLMLIPLLPLVLLTIPLGLGDMEIRMDTQRSTLPHLVTQELQVRSTPPNLPTLPLMAIPRLIITMTLTLMATLTLMLFPTPLLAETLMSMMTEPNILLPIEDRKMTTEHHITKTNDTADPQTEDLPTLIAPTTCLNAVFFVNSSIL